MLAAPRSRPRRRPSVESTTSSLSSSPERSVDEDGDSVMHHINDSQSSLGVSFEDMELDAIEYEERCRQSPITRLPTEIFIYIFAKLSSSQDLLNAMLTCKAWARNSVDLLWHRPATSPWRNLQIVMKTINMENGYFPYHELVKRLNLASLAGVASDGVLESIASCKRIERLTLTDCYNLTDVGVAKLIDGNRALLAIDVTGLERLSDRSMQVIARNCYRLQGLNVSKCRKITDAALVEVAKNSRRLKRLKLNECFQLTDECVMAFADHCRDILEIDLQRVVNLTDMAVTQVLLQAKQLREFRLAHCSLITDQAFLSVPADTPTFDALRILDLTDCNELRDDGISRIIDAAPRLRNLVLAKCRGLTDRGVSAVTRLGKNLHYIHLGHCAQITDHGVSNLVTKCNRIRYIDLACCTNLTDASVELLAQLPKLKRIGLVKCQNITDRSIRALATPRPYPNGALYPNSLERLHLSYCTNLTVSGVRAMLIKCPRLTHLSLTGVQSFLHQDILQFCRPAPSEFNEHQRDVFCVFSGPGVVSLRKYLKENHGGTEEDLDEAESPGMPYDPTTGQFGGMQLAQATFHPHQPPTGQGPVEPAAGSWTIPPQHLAQLQHQLLQLRRLHEHADGHQYAQQGGAPVTFLPPPPPEATLVQQVSFQGALPAPAAPPSLQHDASTTAPGQAPLPIIQVPASPPLPSHPSLHGPETEGAANDRHSSSEEDDDDE